MAEVFFLINLNFKALFYASIYFSSLIYDAYYSNQHVYLLSLAYLSLHYCILASFWVKCFLDFRDIHQNLNTYWSVAAIQIAKIEALSPLCRPFECLSSFGLIPYSSLQQQWQYLYGLSLWFNWKISFSVFEFFT